MKKPNDEQLTFARSMTRRQRDTLRALAMQPFHLSASERGDPELYALVKHKLAICHSTMPDVIGPFMWGATDAGKVIARKQTAGEL
jgi:hypothetical protein